MGTLCVDLFITCSGNIADCSLLAMSDPSQRIVRLYAMQPEFVQLRTIKGEDSGAADTPWKLCFRQQHSLFICYAAGVWEVSLLGERLRCFDAPGTRAVALHDSTLAAALPNCSVTLFSVSSGEPLRTFRVGTDTYCEALRFSSDGAHIIARLLHKASAVKFTSAGVMVGTIFTGEHDTTGDVEFTGDECPVVTDFTSHRIMVLPSGGEEMPVGVMQPACTYGAACMFPVALAVAGNQLFVAFAHSMRVLVFG